MLHFIKMYFLVKGIKTNLLYTVIVEFFSTFALNYKFKQNIKMNPCTIIEFIYAICIRDINVHNHTGFTQTAVVFYFKKHAKKKQITCVCSYLTIIQKKFKIHYFVRFCVWFYNLIYFFHSLIV
ncbi:UNVERIFIED_CONTAM: hypothetical protein NCL1_35930 [Trichonephila clavipes]